MAQGRGASISTGAADGEAVEVALLWGDRPLEIRQFHRGEVPTVGHHPKDSIHVVSRWVGEGFALLRHDGDRRLLRIPERAAAAVYSADGTVSTTREDDDVQEVALRAGDRAIIAIDHLRLAVRCVVPPPRVGVLALASADFSFFKLSAITALMAAAFLAALMIPEVDDELLDDSLAASLPLRTVKSVVAPKPPDPIVLLPSPDAPAPTPAAARTPRHRAASPAPSDHRDVGLLGAMRELGGPGGGVFDGGGLGRDVDAAMENLGRNKVAAVGDGTGGMGSRGTGPGGPGDGLGWKGGVTGGNGAGRPVALRGRPDGDIGAHVASPPERSRIIGGLDRDQIAKVIRRHESEIKYCYESALSQAPDLKGKVAVMFTIDPAGAVADAQVAESTLGSSAAEQCIVNRIRRWKFPEPRGGGVVSVNFPWLFRPAGSE